MGLKEQLKERAQEAGFDLVGVTSADPLPEAEDATLGRLRSGLLDGMGWITEERVRLSCDPTRLLPGAQSIVVLGKSYLAPEPQNGSPGGGPRGRIARYARGDDYHDLLPPRMELLLDSLAASLGVAHAPVGAPARRSVARRAVGRGLVPRRPDDAGIPAAGQSALPYTSLGAGRFSSRLFVDSGPLSEKAVAVRSGVGWFGKNGCVLTRDHGSWVLLAEIVTDLELEPDPPLRRDCGQCRLCLDHCPTGALVEPYVVDARRCISYLTIEHKGAIPLELRSLMGDWVFGCDVCQEVCPHNRLARPTDDAAFGARPGVGSSPALIPLLSLDREGFKKLFRGSPLLRPKRKGLLRNVAVALGNSGDSTAVPALAGALEDEEAVVRSHAAWALGQIGGSAARLALDRALARETDEAVRAGIHNPL